LRQSLTGDADQYCRDRTRRAENHSPPPATRFANHVTYESGHVQDIVGKIYQEIDGRPLQEFRIVQVHGAGVQVASGWAADALHPVLEAPGA